MTESSSYRPVDVRVVQDAEALKALGDPLRLRLLHLVMRSPRRTWSVKEIAAALEQPVTKLYHHVKLLEQAGLIVDVESRLVSGIVEHRYQSGQLSLQFDDALFGSPATRDASIQQAATLVDESRDELVDYLSRPDADIDAVLLSRAYVRLTPEEARAVMAELERMVEGFAAHKGDPEREGLARTAMLFVVHPQPGQPDAPPGPES
jgi:DNA-binding transcriptional ArsR family regulator